MSKTSFSTVIPIVIIVLVVVSSVSGLKPTVYADSESSEGQLTISGLVEQPLNLSLTELAAMPQTSVYAAIICVGNPNGSVAEGNWVGVSLWLLLETAGVSPDAVKVAFHASDGYSTDLTLETARREDIILAYEKDGIPLEETLRLVVPGKWGYKWISDVTVIELVDYDFLGFWESNGYSDTANIGDEIPEFSSVIALLTPLVLVTFFMLLLKKRGKILHV